MSRSTSLMYLVFGGAAVVLLSFPVVLPREVAVPDELTAEDSSARIPLHPRESGPR